MMSDNKDEKSKELFNDLFENDPILGGKPTSSPSPDPVAPAGKEEPKKEETSLEAFLKPKEDKSIALLPAKSQPDDPIWLPIATAQGTVTMSLAEVTGEQFLSWLKEHYPKYMLTSQAKDYDTYVSRKNTFTKVSNDFFAKAYPSITEKNIKYKN